MDKPLSQEPLKVIEQNLADSGFLNKEESRQLVSEVKRLQAIEAERDRYKTALEEIDKYPRGEALVYVGEIKQIANKALKGADTNE